jgi:hypothetical protein
MSYDYRQPGSFQGRVIKSLTFGYDLKDGDKILEALDQQTKILNKLAPGIGAPVNLLPFCAVSNSFLHACSVSWLFLVRHIPSWVPYFSYEPLIRIGRKTSERIKNEPFEFVKNALVCGHYARTFTFTEIACHSTMARRCIHWRASICRS